MRGTNNPSACSLTSALQYLIRDSWISSKDDELVLDRIHEYSIAIKIYLVSIVTRVIVLAMVVIPTPPTTATPQATRTDEADTFLSACAKTPDASTTGWPFAFVAIARYVELV